MNKKVQKGLVAAVAATMGASVVAPVVQAATQTLAQQYEAAYKAYEKAAASKDQKDLTAARGLLEGLYKTVKGTKEEYLATTLSSILDPVQQEKFEFIIAVAKTEATKVEQKNINLAKYNFNNLSDSWKVAFNAYSSAIDTTQQAYAVHVLDMVKAAKTVAELDAAKAKYADLMTINFSAEAKAAYEAAIKPEIAKVEAIVSVPKVEAITVKNSTQVIVAFTTEMGTVDATNFTVDNGLSVVKAEITSNKKEVKLTFNDTLEEDETYEVTVEGVKSVAGVELVDAATAKFTYEIGDIKGITLDQTTFNSTGSTGDDAVDLLDYITIKDENGRDITDETLDNEDYEIVVSSTDSDIIAEGLVVENAKGSAYVEVKVLDSEGDEVVTTEAVKVTVAPYEAVALEGIHIGEAIVDADDYEDLKEDDEVVSSIELGKANSDDDAVQYLNVYAKDSADTIIKVNAASNAKVTNLTPTVATVSIDEDGELVIKTISTGTAKVKVKVGNFETTVSFEVKANSKVTTGTLDTTAVTLTTDADSPSNTGKVILTVTDQYGDKVTAPGTFSISASKSGIVEEIDEELVEASTGKYEIPLTAVENGKTTITVKYKNTSGTVIFTKTFTVTVKDFGTAAKYDLVVAADSADYLDADVDTDETGKDGKDNEVIFELFQVDAAGNKLAKVELDGSENFLKLDLKALTDDEEDLLDQAEGVLAGDTLTFADADDAAKTLVKNGTIKVSAVVGGVNVDYVNVTYKNTDAVAAKAVVSASNIVIDLDNVTSLDEILFGVYGTSKYTVNPLLTIEDQFGKAMKYNVADEEWSTLLNGLTVVPTTVVTNKTNVVIEDGAISLAEGKASGSFTLVISAVDTSVNDDLLAAPVAVTVTVVK